LKIREGIIQTELLLRSWAAKVGEPREKEAKIR